MRRLLAVLAAFLVTSCAWTPAVAGSRSMMGLGKASVTGGGASPPVLAWATTGVPSSGVTTATTSKGANTITVGDYLYIVAALKPNSTVNYSMTCPAGWAQSSWTGNDTSGVFNVMGCGKIAAGGDTGGAFAYTWTGTSANLSQWTLMDFTGANATTPLEDSGRTWNGFHSAPAPIVAPSVTAAGANRLHVSIGIIDGSSNDIYSGFPAGYTQRINGTGSVVQLGGATKTVGSGATGATTWTATLGGEGPGVSLLIQP